MYHNQAMEKKLYIAPSILAADFSQLGAEVQAAEAAGADVIHFDVMDGQFVPNISIGPGVLNAVRRITDLPLDVHLMVDRPERYLKDFVDAGADMLTVHPEATIHLHRTLDSIRSLGAEAGVVLNPGTSESSLDYVLSLVDIVLVMSVNPGFGGQTFIKEVLPKIRRIREMLDSEKSDARLSVDGGIDPETAPWVVSAGANMLVAGSAIFRSESGIRQAIADLRNAGRGAFLKE
jgi:ribulose-phosphate 3-epimerase